MSQPMKWVLMATLMASILSQKVRSQSPPSETEKPLEANQPAALDQFGDPLPKSAIARMGTVRFRQGDFWGSVAFSPDGKLIASTGDDSTFRLWDAATGRQLRRIERDRLGSLGVAFSPDGKTVAAGGDTVHLWDLNSWAEVSFVKDRIPDTRVIGFLPEGKSLAVQLVGHETNANALIVWDPATGKKTESIMAEKVLALSLDRKTIAYSKKESPGIYLWDITAAKPVGAIKMPSEAAQASAHYSNAAFAPDGKCLALGILSIYHQLPAVSLWEIPTGKEICTFEGTRDSPDSLAFSPDGKTLVTGHYKCLRLWDVAKGRELRKFGKLQHSVGSISFAPDGKSVVVKAGRTISKWDVATGEELCPLIAHQSSVASVALSPDGKTVATASADQTVRLWEAGSGKQLRLFVGHERDVTSISFSPDGKTLASGSDDETLCLWDVATGKVIHKLGSQNQSETRRLCVRTVVFSPDGKALASGGFDKTIVIWNPATGRQIQRLEAAGLVKALAISPDGKTLASVAETGKSRWDMWARIVIWNLDTGKELRVIEEEKIHFTCVRFSPDGKSLATGGHRRMLHLWDPVTGKKLRQFKGLEDGVTGVAFSPDGKTLASSGYDKAITIWDASTGRQLGRLIGHQSHVLGLAYSPDGKSVVSGSDDCTALVWDVSRFK